jgi:hypothetical protein
MQSEHYDARYFDWQAAIGEFGGWANLGGPSHNSVVIRNWPTFNFETAVQSDPQTALYSGNLGYGHDGQLLVAAREHLRDAGYRITLRAGDPGVRHLPAWLKVQPLHADPNKLKEDLQRHEVHLIAALPKITQTIFPSKIWNSVAAGPRLICTGFADEMAEELEIAKRVPFENHLKKWTELLVDLLNCRQLSRIGESVAVAPARSEFQPAALV